MRNREVQIKFYATEKERESIRRNAKRAGMKMGEYARAVLTSDDVSIKVIDTQPLKKAAHELAKQGTNLNQFMKFLNTYGVKVFDPEEAKRVLQKEVSSFSETHGSARGAPQGSRPEQHPSANRGLRQPR